MSARPSEPGSPLRGRYLVRNRLWNLTLRATDAVLSALVRTTRANLIGEPGRILIAVGGQLGDAVIATSVLPILARTFPSAEFGMLLPSWSRVVVEEHPRLRWIHHADHWKINRSRLGRAAKWRAYQSSATRAITEMQTVGYDVAVDLYAYYPNAAWLLWRAGIPIRIGYASGGGGPLYTSAIDWTPTLGHTTAQHDRLIREMTNQTASATIGYDLPPLSMANRAAANALANGRYVVIHPGTGDPQKAWSLSHWHALVAELERRGERVVITGAGRSESELAVQLANDRVNVLNLVDTIDWPTFRGVLSNAAIAIGPDSVAMHIAAAQGTPAVAIMAAVSNPEYWRPLGERVAVLTHPVPCAPCFRKDGCAEMSCVRDVSVDEVLRAMDSLEIDEAKRG